MVYFGNLAWRSLAEIGTRQIHAPTNDTGPDGANHTEHGIFVFSKPEEKLKNEKPITLSILQIAPLILDYFNISG
jgi:predicted AlkP superfamily phosphohydrolase/phosphomutase